MSNSVTVFSNGIADFIRSYPVKKGDKCEISIPVKKSHVGDVLASLNLFGDVKLDSPPSFSPSKSLLYSDDLDSDFHVDTANVLYDLATKLSGSKVSVSLYTTEKATKGTLMGVHTQEMVTDSLQSNDYSLVVITEDNKIVRISFEDVHHICFADETVQSEIDKALQRNFQKVKPNSTFVNLTVVGGEKDSEAYIQYTVPAAAWKISYRLNKNGNKFNLKGLAIVDNNTEEDWKDVIVSVVTGEPITFSTDLAQSKTPNRGHVNIVNDNAVASVEVDRGVRSKRLGNARSMTLCSAAPMGRGLESADGNQMESMDYTMNESSSVHSELSSAIVSDSEIKEVGDFAIFKSNNPLTISSNRSAVIPVFDSELSETQDVLHYSFNNNNNRAYRSLHFKNETEHALGRGVCTVYFDGIYSGSCVLPAAKKGEDNLMPYALETGVKILKNHISSQNKLSSIKISGGLVISQNVTENVCKYIFDNSKNEAFEVYLDHDVIINHNVRVLAHVQEVDKENLDVYKTLSNGLRYKLNLKPLDLTEVFVSETYVNENTIKINSNQLDWFINQYITNGPLKDSAVLENLIGFQQKISDVKDKVVAANDRVSQLVNKQNRLRENMKVSSNSPMLNTWVAELNESESELTKIEENEIPSYKNELISLQKEIQDYLINLTFDWKI